MRVDELVGELYDMVEKAWSFPLSRGRVALDGAEVKEILDELRAEFPKELEQARAIVADRSKIIDDAKREAENIIRGAQTKAKAMVAGDEITREAQKKAADMLSQSQTKSREMKRASNEYIDDLMKRADEGLAGCLSELRQTRQSIKATQHTGSPN
jgi:F0F1-type ATP synthase membrane subunit b/b'